MRCSKISKKDLENGYKVVKIDCVYETLKDLRRYIK